MVILQEISLHIGLTGVTVYSSLRLMLLLGELQLQLVVQINCIFKIYNIL
mgnify:CR=1 FL=1